MFENVENERDEIQFVLRLFEFKLFGTVYGVWALESPDWDLGSNRAPRIARSGGRI